MPPTRRRAEVVIQRWNDQLALGRDMLWSPTIRAALLAGTPWLDVFCAGCGTTRAIDLRTIDRHPLASVGSHRRRAETPRAPQPGHQRGLFALPPARSGCDPSAVTVFASGNLPMRARPRRLSTRPAPTGSAATGNTIISV
jgi:hypothetical protein